MAGAIAAAESRGHRCPGPPRRQSAGRGRRPGYADAWTELNALSRAEVSQATGMLVAQLIVEGA